MPEPANLTLHMEPEFHWWGVRFYVRINDSMIPIAKRKEIWHNVTKPDFRRRLRYANLADLKWWQVMTFRVESWGRLLTQEEWNEAHAQFHLRQFEESPE